VQRVAEARVRVGEETVGEIGPGLCVLLGVARGDEEIDAERLAGRVARLRIFENEEGRFDRSLLDIGGAALVVSQFTLIADTAKGNRPSFTEAASPAEAKRLYQAFCSARPHARRARQRRPCDDHPGRLTGGRSATTRSKNSAFRSS